MINYLLKILMIIIFCNHANSTEIIIRSTSYPPQYYIKDGKWTGLDIELARAVVEKAGFKAVVKEIPWTRSLTMLQEGGLHIMANLSRTEERDEFLRWIGPERTSKLQLVVASNNVNLKVENLGDLITASKVAGIKFGFQKDLHYSQEFNLRMKTDAKFRNSFDEVVDSNLNHKKTIFGRILGYFEDSESIKFKIKNDKEYENLSLHDFILQQEEVYFGVSKKGVKFKDFIKLENAFRDLEKSGDLEEIRKTEFAL